MLYVYVTYIIRMYYIRMLCEVILGRNFKFAYKESHARILLQLRPNK